MYKTKKDFEIAKNVAHSEVRNIEEIFNELGIEIPKPKIMFLSPVIHIILELYRLRIIVVLNNNTKKWSYYIQYNVDSLNSELKLYERNRYNSLLELIKSNSNYMLIKDQSK